MDAYNIPGYASMYMLYMSLYVYIWIGFSSQLRRFHVLDFQKYIYCSLVIIHITTKQLWTCTLNTYMPHTICIVNFPVRVAYMCVSSFSTWRWYAIFFFILKKYLSIIATFGKHYFRFVGPPSKTGLYQILLPMRLLIIIAYDRI